MMQYITGGLFIFFLLLLFYLLFHIWLEGRREQTKPHEIAGEEFPEALREAVLRPLKLLNGYYAKRDPGQVDARSFMVGREPHGCCKAIGNTGDNWRLMWIKPRSFVPEVPYTLSCGERLSWITFIFAFRSG